MTKKGNRDVKKVKNTKNVIKNIKKSKFEGVEKNGRNLCKISKKKWGACTSCFGRHFCMGKKYLPREKSFAKGLKKSPKNAQKTPFGCERGVDICKWNLLKKVQVKKEIQKVNSF